MNKTGFFDVVFDQDASVTLPYGSFEFEGQTYTVDLEIWHETMTEVWVSGSDGKMAPPWYTYGADLDRHMQALNEHLRKMTRDLSITAEHDGIDFILV